MHQIYLLFCFGQIIRNMDRICYLVKRRCSFSEYSISSPTKRIFYPNWPLPKRCSFFLCKITHIACRICTQQRFASKIMLMAKICRSIPLGARTRRPQTALTSSSTALRACSPPAFRSHPPTANSTYQQFSAAARLFAACTPAAPTSQRITVDGLYCTPTENLSRFCKIFAIFRINCFPVWNN